MGKQKTKKQIQNKRVKEWHNQNRPGYTTKKNKKKEEVVEKGLLIIDIPKSCAECDIICESYYTRCHEDGFDDTKRLDSCPLRKLPKKKNSNEKLVIKLKI